MMMKTDPIFGKHISEGLELLHEEIMYAIKQVKAGKVAGADKVMMAHLKALDDTLLNILV